MTTRDPRNQNRHLLRGRDDHHRDRGTTDIAFNPLLDAPKPDLDAEVEDRTVGGLGIYLVRTMMDEVRYERQAKQELPDLGQAEG